MGDMNIKALEKIIFETRKQLGFSVEVTPNVLGFYRDQKENFMVVIVADRPDKSATFGPGGLVSKTLAKNLRLAGVTVKAQTDLLVKKFRIRLAIRRLRKLSSQTKNKKIKTVISRKLIPLLKKGFKHLLGTKFFESEASKETFAVVGFSGGVDSWVATILAKKAGLNPIAVSVAPEKWVLPEKTRKLIKKLTSTYNIQVEFLDEGKEGFKQIFKDGLNGKIHPCGRCRKLIEETVVSYAKKNEIPIVLFGDLLPTGNYSAHLVNGILRFNVLAALNLTKSETIVTAKMFKHPGVSFTYGCPMLREIHKRHKHLTYPSIQRVLRETRSGVLEPNQALKYIKSILAS